MRLYNRRDELRANTRDSAHLSVSGALQELAAPKRPPGFPDEEWVVVKRAREEVRYFSMADLGGSRMRSLRSGAATWRRWLGAL